MYKLHMSEGLNFIRKRRRDKEFKERMRLLKEKELLKKAQEKEVFDLLKYLRNGNIFRLKNKITGETFIAIFRKSDSPYVIQMDTLKNNHLYSVLNTKNLETFSCFTKDYSLEIVPGSEYRELQNFIFDLSVPANVRMTWASQQYNNFRLIKEARKKKIPITKLTSKTNEEIEPENLFKTIANRRQETIEKAKKFRIRRDIIIRT